MISHVRPCRSHRLRVPPGFCGILWGYSSNSSLAVDHSTEWLQFDLGSAQSVSRVDLYPRTDGVNVGYGFPIDFTLRVSTDGTTWTTVVTRTGYPRPGAAVQSFSFATAIARYVKVAATKLRSNPNDSNEYRLQLAEVEVF